MRTYSELIQYSSFGDRFRYLSLRGEVGAATFGFDRWLNQQFYTSRQWRALRHHIIVRDEGCDLGVPGYEVTRRPIIHHMNPLTVEDIVHGSDEALDPEFLILVSHETHNAIHYGDESLLPKPFVARAPGDTQLWTRRSR
jgi:hypothetical protein